MDQFEELVPILVADDQADNLLVMQSLLTEMALPLHVVLAEGGTRALRLSLQQNFALIFLDIQMPDMNGYEVAELLRAHPKTSTTPIIFMTAGMNTEHQVIKGYETGAVDYLSKPLDRRQLASKVRVFCELFQQRRTLERSEQHLEAEVRRRNTELLHLNEELENRVEERGKQIKLALSRVVETERHKALNHMVAGVAHELNTPIGVILLSASTLDGEIKRLLELVNSEQVSRRDLIAICDHCQKGAQLIEANAHRAAALVSSFKELGERSESGAQMYFELRRTIEAVLAEMHHPLQAAGVLVEKDLSDDISMYGLPELLQRIISILINNSLTHAFSGQTQPCITLKSKRHQDQLILNYYDNGCGVPKDDLPRLFDPFFTTRLGQGGSGLGLSIVYSLTVEKMGGHVHVSGAPGQGLHFEFHWPLRPN